jgi:carbonic anhydrase
MTNYSEFEFRKQPWFDQNNFPGFDQAIPMKSIAIYCFDPRAADIPKVVAEYFGDEVYPGENILDEAGNRVGSTQSLFTLSNAGGRAIGALQSVATMNYLFNNLERLIVVHHSFCGATSFEPNQLIEKFHDHFHADISNMWNHEDLAISDYERSIKHDVELLRSSPATPKKMKIYGFFYDITSGKLTEVLRDIPSED